MSGASPDPLEVAFRDALAQIEKLVASGELDETEADALRRHVAGLWVGQKIVTLINQALPGSDTGTPDRRRYI